MASAPASPPPAAARRPSIFRSERIGAVVLLLAAAVGLVLANSPLGPALLDLRQTTFGPDAVSLSLEHWISDGLLVLFFFTAAIELKHELLRGELASVSKALRPAIAAVCGVAVPALVYLLIAGRSGYAEGWPIPTATDIAFALGVLALFGAGIPSRIRVFLLALAVIDDIIAIVLIAVFFTDDLDVAALALAVVALIAFAALARVRTPWIAPITIATGVVVWFFVLESGVHATVAGVALGLAMPLREGMRSRHVLEPWVNGVVLPIFALSAAMVALPDVGLGELSAPFWAILVALPVGKIVGIVLGGWIGTAVDQRKLKPAISKFSLATVGALGGIGFTVSLLMNELAFAGQEEIAAEGTLAVLGGSSISLVAASVLVALLARRFRLRDGEEP
jgi:NhaA family Na+:H+ antiporter